MRILLLGSGGREHALARKLSESPTCSQLFIAPGNPGTAQHGINIAASVLDFAAIAEFCVSEKIEMVVVGPEDPLVNGIYDYFQQHESLQSIHVIGPSREAAQLEGSKAFAKAFMNKYAIPTAAYREFSQEQLQAGLDYLAGHTLPVVLKADGLAAGKGVVIAETHQEAADTLREMLAENKFGSAGHTVVVESFLTGIECSVFVLSDGIHYSILPVAKDYKRIGEGDTGLNTGGMGAISPVPFANATFMKKVEERIIRPTVNGLAAENFVYKGFIFIGLIKVGDEPYVIEYNCRMGDPETEVVMPRLDADLVALLSSLRDQKLDTISCAQTSAHAATVMLVSAGYPGDYEKGKKIGLPQDTGNSILFHAGTRLDGETLVTHGGRVMAITTLADNLEEALVLSKQVAESIDFEGKNYRKDIGWEFCEQNG